MGDGITHHTTSREENGSKQWDKQLGRQAGYGGLFSEKSEQEKERHQRHPS